MKITGIKYENVISDYAIMDPLNLMERVSIPGYRVLAALDDDDTPVGCVMFFEGDDELILEWIYVMPAYIGLGVTYFLNEKLKELATGRFSKLALYIPEVYGRKCVCPDEKSFISEVFPGPLEAAAGEWYTTLEAIGRHPLFTDDTVTGYIADSCDIANLDELKWAEMTLSVTHVEAQKEKIRLYDVMEYDVSLDLQLSLVSFDKGSDRSRLNGVLMLQRVGDTIYPVLAWGRDGVAMKSLIRAVVQNALAASCQKRTQIRLILKQERDFYSEDLYSFLDDIFQVKKPGFGRHIPAKRLEVKVGSKPYFTTDGMVGLNVGI